MKKPKHYTIGEMKNMSKDEVINYCKELQMDIRRLKKINDKWSTFFSKNKLNKVTITNLRSEVNSLKIKINSYNKNVAKIEQLKEYIDQLSCAIRRINFKNLNLNLNKEVNNNGF